MAIEKSEELQGVCCEIFRISYINLDKPMKKLLKTQN